MSRTDLCKRTQTLPYPNTRRLKLSNRYNSSSPVDGEVLLDLTPSEKKITVSPQVLSPSPRVLPNTRRSRICKKSDTKKPASIAPYVQSPPNYASKNSATTTFVHQDSNILPQSTAIVPEMLTAMHIDNPPWLNIPLYLMEPLNGADQVVACDPIMEFILHQKILIAEGRFINSVFGPTAIDLETVFNASDIENEPATVSRWVASMLQPYDTLGVPERLGLTLLSSLLLRWRISPSEETYECLPPFMKPTVTQLVVPHLAWIDFIPWPDVRDIFIIEPQAYETLKQCPEFVSGFLEMHWPYSPAQMLDSTFDGTSPTLTTLFEHHALNLENWSIEPDAVPFCPTLASKIRVEAERKDKEHDVQLLPPSIACSDYTTF